MGYVTQWRITKYRKLIREGNKEAILKFLNSKLNKNRPIQEIIVELEQLNSPLWKEFLKETLEKMALMEILEGKINYHRLGFRRKGVEVLKYYANQRIYKQIKEELKRKFEEYQKLAIISPKSRDLSKGRKFIKLRVRKSKYFGTIKDSLESIIKNFEIEILEELELSKKVLSSDELEYLKYFIERRLENLINKHFENLNLF